MIVPASGLNNVYLLPKELDKKVAKLHFLALGTELNVPTQTQADCTGVKVEGPSRALATGHRSLEMLCSLADQALAQLHLSKIC